MNSEQIEAIKARAADATPGPWAPAIGFCGGLPTAYGPSHDGTDAGTDAACKDADFIAHARTDVPALVAEVERLRAEADELRRKLHIHESMAAVAAEAERQGRERWGR